MAGGINVTWIGRRKFQAEMAKAGAMFSSVLGNKMLKAAEVGIGSAKQQFFGSRTRVTSRISRGSVKYRRKGGKRGQDAFKASKRFAAAKDDMLSVFTGQYRKSISADVYRKGKSWEAEIGPPASIKYARIHEYGGAFKAWGKYPAKMPARPVIGPGLKKAEAKIVKILGSAFRVVLP